MSILITVISNTTVLKSQNIIFFRFFMYMIHDVNKKAPPSAFSHLPSHTRFSSGLLLVLQEIPCQPFLAVIRLFAKDNAFSKKIRLFVLAHSPAVLIFLFCLCVFLRRFFTVMPS